MQTMRAPAVRLQTAVWVTFGLFPVSDFLTLFFPLSCLKSPCVPEMTAYRTEGTFMGALTAEPNRLKMFAPPPDSSDWSIDLKLTFIC